jgi:hypothetical protein
MAKKNRICIILWLIVLFLLFCLWQLKINTVKESFGLLDNNTFTALGSKASDALEKTGDYIDANSDGIFNDDGFDLKSSPEIMQTNFGFMPSDLPYLSNADNYTQDEIIRTQIKRSSMAYLAKKQSRSLAETVEMATYNPAVFANDRFINVGDPNTTGLNSTALRGANYTLNELTTDIINDEPEQEIQWDKVSLDLTKNAKNNIRVVKNPSSPPIVIDDACSSKGFLNSNFKEDICNTNGGNFNSINEKCQQLSPENCAIPSCCVLMNGNTCSAGTIRGPTYLTKNGRNVDFTYYYYKKKCYGTGCEMAKEYEAACNKFDNNSTGISKDCMIKMFNIHGCPNSEPNDLINDSMVQNYSLSSKKFVNDYIKTAVGIVKHNIANGIDASNNNITCYGEPKKKNDTSASAAAGDGRPKPVESLDDVGAALNRGLDSL